MPKVLNARQAGTKPAADRVYVGRSGVARTSPVRGPPPCRLLPQQQVFCCVAASEAMGQELTSTGVPTGIERQKRLVRYCRGYLRPSACVVP